MGYDASLIVLCWRVYRTCVSFPFQNGPTTSNRRFGTGLGGTTGVVSSTSGSTATSRSASAATETKPKKIRSCDARLAQLILDEIVDNTNISWEDISGQQVRLSTAVTSNIYLQRCYVQCDYLFPNFVPGCKASITRNCDFTCAEAGIIHRIESPCSWSVVVWPSR